MSIIANGRSASLKERNVLVSEYGEVITSSASGIGLPTQFFLTQTGDGTGDCKITGDYSASPVDYYYQAASKYDIHQILIAITDDKAFNQSDYGGIPAGTVVNGIKFFVQPSGGPEIPLLSGKAFTANYEWLAVSSNVYLTTFAGLAQTMSIVFDVTSGYGIPLVLNAGDRIITRFNDDFSALTCQSIGLRGIKYFSNPAP